MTAIKLRPISYMVLGMLRLGATSGYAIKKAADASTRNLWPMSLSQVYPELARLEEHGLVTRHEDPHGARERSAYELTEEGEAALLTWLRSAHETPLQVRSESMLRLFFADVLSVEDQIELVQRMRDRYREAKVHMYDGDLRSALADFEEAGISYPVILGLLGEAYYDVAVKMLTELEEELEAKKRRS
jgi:DNA-binding PadR family transcriptional regulator